MRPMRIALASVAVALSFGAADALAFNCYEVIDKDQTFIYRASSPPFGMEGEEWNKGQDELRAKGLHLRWAHATDCSPTIIHIRKAEATTKSADVVVYDPNVVLRSTPEYMTATGRPTPMVPSYGR
jgi:hypothetical protein